MPDLIGQTLGSYRILNQIGKGGMATVYRAFQPSLERYVAVKVLPPYYAQQDETFLKRFRLEARSIARLRHPNILTIYEYGEESETTYIVMEYVEAGTLTELLGQPLPLRQVEPILRQVASALQYAHEQNVIHRDVKPSNILLPKPDWPLLTDFGLARIVGGASLTQTGTIAGTPAYMSPEQGRGETPDHRTDIYSLGIVLYEMVTGAVPFTAETPMAVIVKHIIDPLPLPRTINPDLPERVEAVILKALAKQPDDRYAHASEIAQAFSDAIAAAPVVVATAETPKPAPPLLAQGPALSAGERPALSAERSRKPALSLPKGVERPRRRILPIVLAIAGIFICGLVSLGALVRARNAGPDTKPPVATEPVAVEPGQDPRTLDQLMADAAAKLDQGDVDGAVADFQMAVAADPENLDRYWEISGILSSYGYPDHARGFVDAASGVGPDEASFHDTAGWQYHGLGAYAEAAAHFQRALELDPESLWAYIGLADALQGLGDWETARSVLDTLAAHEPVSDPDLYENLGWNYAEHGAYPEAQAAFREAVTLDAAKTGAWSGLIDATYYAEGAGPAWNVAQEAIAWNPNDPSLHESVGDLAWELGDLASAEAEYLTSTQLDPAYSSGYTSLASLYEDQGRMDEAVAILQFGLENNPQDPWLHEALGQSHFDRGEAETAFQYFSAASDLDPTYGWFPVQAAQAYYQFTGDAAGAAEYLARADAAQPYDPDLLDSIGQVFEAMGDCASAYAYYSRVLELNPAMENSQAGLTRCGG